MQYRGMVALFLAASPEAWRFVAWRYFEPKRQMHRLLPADHFEPLPE